MDITAKGGNHLLNVGPTAEGVIPQASQDNLREVGAWLKVNGEAVFDTTRSPFGEEFGEYAAHLGNRAGQPVFLPFSDWRCTAKPGRLYFTLFHVERDGQQGYFRFPSFKNPIKSVRLLGDPQQAALEVKTDAEGRRYFHPSRYINDSMGMVYVVEIEGEKVER